MIMLSKIRQLQYPTHLYDEITVETHRSESLDRSAFLGCDANLMTTLSTLTSMMCAASSDGSVEQCLELRLVLLYHLYCSQLYG